MLIAQFQVLVEIWNGDDEVEWEEQGGRRREFCDLSTAIHRALGRKPWQTDITSTLGQDTPPPWLPAARIEDWHEARALRARLEQAAAEG